MSQPILAIDFGTSNSLVGAWFKGARREALPVDNSASDPTLMRTLLYFPHDRECYYGTEAMKKYIENEMEGRLFRSFKTHLPNRNYLGTVVGDRVMPLENIVGVFLLELKRRSEAILGAEVQTVVLGRPARYSMDAVADQFAVHRMKKAAEFAKFKNVHFIPEPLAAAFDIRRRLQDEKIALIGDFGGGTSDFTLIRLRPGEFVREDVLAIEGCPLAGDAFDSLFMSHRLNEHFGAKSNYRVPLGSNVMRMPVSIAEKLNHPAHIIHLKERDTYEFIRDTKQWALTELDRRRIEQLFILMDDQQVFPFFEEIEGVKRRLSTDSQTRFDFDYPGIHISESFTRADFGVWADSTREKIFAALDRCLSSAGISASDVDLIFLTGGTAKVPLVQNEFVRRFGSSRFVGGGSGDFHSVLSGLIESAGLLEKGIVI